MPYYYTFTEVVFTEVVVRTTPLPKVELLSEIRQQVLEKAPAVLNSSPIYRRLLLCTEGGRGLLLVAPEEVSGAQTTNSVGLLPPMEGIARNSGYRRHR